MRKAKKNQRSLHLLGLFSDGGIHSHIDHLLALLKIAKKEGIKDVFIHAFTDGRDTSPKCAKKFIKLIPGQISTISGRFYAMDRDNHWERVEKVYRVLTGKSSNIKKSAISAIDQGYQKGESDETIEPAIISLGDEKQFIRRNDSVIIFNFRADRAREITLCLGQKDFNNFKRGKGLNLNLATMTPYETDWKMEIQTIFSGLKYQSTLSDLLAENNVSQLHIAETEKYAHVTYFFNGGREKEANKEKYLCIPSPRIEIYADKPEMSLHQVASELLAEVSKKSHQFIAVNFANPDMVGHSGDFEATKMAIEAVDKNLDFLLSGTFPRGFEIFITADHGNAEQMINLETGEIDKEHTTNPVFLLKAKDIKKGIKFLPQEHKKIWQDLALEPPRGVLADITPTIAELLGFNSPNFSGESLIDLLR